MASGALEVAATRAPQVIAGGTGLVLDLRRHRVDINGLLIDRVDLIAAMRRIRTLMEIPGGHQIITVNLDFLSIAERNPLFRDTINRAELAVADGMPLVWVSRLQGDPLPQRITGVELVDQSCRIAVQTGHSIFLLGARPWVVKAAASELQARHPGLQIAGVHSPPFRPLTPHEDQEIVSTIRQASPGFLFVAFGAPRQDLWIRAHLAELDVPIAIGVGCVFDVLAGVVRRAPSWMQQAGLEWSYRFLQEPSRLWRRYLLDDAPMLGRLVFESFRDRRTRMATAPTPIPRHPA